MTDLQPIGAYITYQYLSAPDVSFDGYLSFGEYDEETDCDTYGVSDEQIIFYCSPDDMPLLLSGESKEGDTRGWKVLTYAYCYGTYEGMSSYGTMDGDDND